MFRGADKVLKSRGPHQNLGALESSKDIRVSTIVDLYFNKVSNIDKVDVRNKYILVHPKKESCDKIK